MPLLQSRQNAIAAEVKVASGQLGKVARYNELKKDVETNTTLANDLYRRIKEAGIAAGARATDMAVVDPARVLDRPTRPNWALNLSAGALHRNSGWSSDRLYPRKLSIPEFTPLKISGA